MGGTELEEGEARANHDDDRDIDIDVALSYIDKKIQDVLGHYQKDFEGGISVENLGAKFGGYGSFLPTYQRTPIMSHPRTPQRVQNHSTIVSSHDLPLPVEGAPWNSKVSSNVIPSIKPLPASSSAPLLPVVRTSSVDSLDKLQSSRECVSYNKADKLPISQSNPKMLKVRIKVGPGNDMLAQKNAAIYSNLGLDLSPSSSSEDSPAEWEENYLDSLEKLNDSPSCIITIMTSFPIPNGVLLSPLSDSLVHFVEEKDLLNSIISGPVQDNSTVSRNGAASVNRDKGVPGEKNKKPGNDSGRLVEVKKEKCKDFVGSIISHLKNETDKESSMGKEILSEDLKLPLRSNKVSKFNGTADDFGKASEVNMGGARDRIVFSNVGKEEIFGSVSSQEASRTGKQNVKSSLAGKVPNDKGVVHNPRIDGEAKSDTSLDVFVEGGEMPKSIRDCSGGTIDPPRRKFEKKATSHLQDKLKIPKGEEKLSRGGQKKLEGRQEYGSSAAKKSKESLRVSFSAVPKDRSTQGSSFPSKNKGDEKLQDGLRKAKVSHSDLTGNKKLEKKECKSTLLGTPIKDQASNNKLEILEKGLHSFNNKSKGTSDGRKSNFPSMSNADLKEDLIHATPLTGPLPTEGAPVVIEENWVCCDKCHKWRLLPYGTNPDHLPKKWLCSMLNWLPGMNRCSFSEEETTNALNALYQVPVYEIHNNPQSYSSGTASGVILVDAHHHNQKPHGINVAPSGGMKKLGTKRVSTATRHSGSMNLLNSSMKNQQATVESDANPLRMKSKRETDQDGFRLSKKAKTESAFYTDNQNVDVLAMKEIEVDNQKYNEFSSSRDRTGIVMNSSVNSVKKSKNQVQKIVADHDKSYIVGKKRKLKDWHHTEGDWTAMEEKTSGSECRKVKKKARESKLQEKESNRTKASGKPDRKGRVTKILLSSTEKDGPLKQFDGNISSQRTADGKNSSRRDLEVRQPGMDATSSSSMISSTCKIKVNFQEVKGSPVESVCSSPLRIYNRDILARSLSEKERDANVQLSLLNSQTRFLEGEGEGDCLGDKYEVVRKEKSFSATHCMSMESSLFDNRDGGSEYRKCGKVKSSTGHFSKLLQTQLVSGCQHDDRYFNKLGVEDICHDNERVNNQYGPNGPLPSKSRCESFSEAKEKLFTPVSGFDEGRSNISDSYNEQEDSHCMKYKVENDSQDCAPSKEERVENDGYKFDKVEKNYIGKKVSSRECRSDSNRRENQFRYEGYEGVEDSQWKADKFYHKDEKSTSQRNMLQNHSGGRSLKWLPSGGTGLADVAAGGGKSLNCPLFGNKQENPPWYSQSGPNSREEGEYNVLPVDCPDGGDLAEAAPWFGKDDDQNEFHHVSSMHCTANGNGARSIFAPNHVKKDTSSRAANNALKEAKNLKHSAHRLKISGSGLESTKLFFQAALKFLHGASLLDPCNSNSAKCDEMTSIEFYSSTAKLCEYCAREYERCKDMASAALAYKCMEVAYMRIIYSSDSTATRDRNVLQISSQMVCPVESPSSSASDVDNSNNEPMVGKRGIAKDVGSLSANGNRVIAARNWPSFVRLLNFSQDVNLAMKASRKSQIAFAAANVVLAETGNVEGISSVKRVLDISFHDLEGLLRLVSLAMETLNK